MAKNRKPIALMVTDLHLDKNNGELVTDIFNQIIELCEEYDISTIINGGDIFTNRSGQPLSTLTTFKEIVDKLAYKQIRMHVIPGNHDKTDANSESSYIDLFVGDYLTIYDKLGYYIKNVCFWFIPYFKDDKWIEEFEKINSNKANAKTFSAYDNILITHSGFEGVMNNDGSKVESVIKPSMFSDFDKVLVGHYHNASKLGDNVYYVGSAYQNNFGETITDKGFTIIYDDASIKHIPSKFPKYIKEDVEVTDKENLRNLIEKYGGDDYNHVRFVFHGKKLDCDKINMGELAKAGIDAKFESDEQIEAMEISESDSVLSFDKKTLMKDFIKFCQQSTIRGEELKYGLDLVKIIK